MQYRLSTKLASNKHAYPIDGTQVIPLSFLIPEKSIKGNNYNLVTELHLDI